MSLPEDINAKLKLQDELREMIAKGKINFKKTSKERLTFTYCEIRLENLERTWLTFENTHKEIVSKLDKATLSSTSYYKSSGYELTEELFFEYKTMLRETILKLKPNDNSYTNVESVKHSKVKLPAVNIPNFNGEYSQWPSFRDLFISLVDKNDQLDKVQKLHYLKCHISGEAESLLRFIPITADNYNICWQKLESRYDNKKYISNQILGRFMGLKNLSVESANAIKLLLDNMNECLHALNNIGVNTSSWDIIIIYLLSQKLDPNSRKEWEAKASEGTDLNTLDEFREFLNHKYRSLEYLDSNKSRPKGYSGKTVLHVLDEEVNVNHTTSSVNCQFCNGNHKLTKCNLFKKETYAKRHDFVKTNGLCFNCLGVNHSVFACRQSIRCNVCKRKHNLLLHPENSNASTSEVLVGEKKLVAAIPSTSVGCGDSSDVIACFSTVRSQVLLATALVNIQSKTGVEVTLRCLVDQGSQASFITESAVQKLGLKKSPSRISITGIGSENCTVASNSVVNLKLRSIHDSSCVVEVKAHVLSKLTTFLPRHKVAVQMWPELQTLELADPRFNIPNKIEILLGAEIYSQIILEGIIRGPVGFPVAQKTKFGWILSGLTKSSESETENIVVNSAIDISVFTQVPEDNLLRQFWETEAEPFTYNHMLTEEETKCEELFQETTRRDTEGRYIVKLPFRNEDPVCKYGKSKDIATLSLFRLERRLAKDIDLKMQYSNGMRTYLESNHMEKVPLKQRNKESAVYLSHHAVVRTDRTTTKVRIVFNASQKGKNGVSLNDDLLVGPKLQPDLRELILRWRRHPICLSADIVKMYLQVKVTEEDSDFLRLLWRDENGAVEHYRMNRVTFGTASAPYLAVKALQQLAIDEGEQYPVAAEKVLKDFYMDDLMSGCETVEEALKIYKEMNLLLKKGCFTLQKWISNSTEFLEKAGESEMKLEKGIEIGAGKDIEVVVRKVLGLNWQSVEDVFTYSVQLPEMKLPITKRRVISNICRLFDPLGFLAPVIITAKIFIQKLWISGIEWDQELPSTLLQEWIAFRDELTTLTNFNIKRWIEIRCDYEQVELQGFCDASEEAYAAVIYVRVVDRYGKVHVNLVTSKTKVAPVKQISIPRLELCGAVLLAKLLDEVSKVLHIPKHKIHAWTDSSIVLAWLSSHPRKWNTFVANRVSEIISRFNRNHWRHIRSGENPADIASRGMKPAEFIESMLWKKGPKFLSEENIIYSPLEEEDSVFNTYGTKEEIKVKCFSNVSNEEVTLFIKFSTLRKQLRVIARCRRFFKMISNKPKHEFPIWLTSTELKEAMKLSIKYSQNHYFSKEIEDLKRNRCLSKTSSLKSLTPFLDSDGILRVGGRLQNAQRNEESKHPALIPRYSHLAKLIVGEAHDKTLHGGAQLMLCYIRSKYWIVGAKNMIKAHIHGCVVCIRHAARSNNPLMGQLPLARATPSRPFKRRALILLVQ